MQKFFVTFFLKIILFTSCSNIVNDGFISKELISSQGECLYINSLNYGVTSDHQITIITKDKNHLKFEIDTNDVVFGLDPFLYSFTNDTLTLFFNQNAKYKIEDTFTTIKINYKIVSNRVYMDLMRDAIAGKEISRVPELEDLKVDHNIPKPPTR